MKTISAGQLKTKVIFYKPTGSDDGYDDVNYVPDFNKKVKFETGKPTETEISGKLVSVVMHKVITRYSNKVTAKHRLLISGRFFEVVGEPINVDFANRVTEIFVREITNA